jgi:hypothetical protein
MRRCPQLFAVKPTAAREDSKMTNEDNQKIELSEAQQNPSLAHPADFAIGSPLQSGDYATPGHGQCGDSKAEYAKLVAQGNAAHNRPAPARNQVPDRRLSDE